MLKKSENFKTQISTVNFEYREFREKYPKFHIKNPTKIFYMSK